MPEDTQLEKLHEKVDAVSADVQSAKGMMKATMALLGAAQAVLVPAFLWLAGSVVTLREDNIATKIRLERVEYKCGESVSSSSTALPLQTASRNPWKDSSKNTRPAVSGRWDTTTLSSLMDCE